MENTQANDRSFTRDLLPWIIGGAALLVYLLTLNGWVSFSSLGQVAKVSGWTWQPEVTAPLFWLVTYPFRLLPDSFVPLALNLFTAICAGLTLSLLGRTVALLPYNRTEEQRRMQTGAHSVLEYPWPWIPPVIAVIICGLQLTFWENATAITGEMFDLLLFALVGRFLMEYRVSDDERWLTRAAFVYGAAMTNNWAMIAFFPYYLGALMVLRGWKFIDVGWLMQMFFWGMLGLSFYLLLPLVIVLTSPLDISFWQALKFNLANQKSYLTAIFSTHTLFSGTTPLWVVALPSLIPLMIFAIRWPASSGDISKLGIGLTRWMFHFFHAVMFVFALWVALDPLVSPRRIIPGLAALPIYYLAAIVAGYTAGYMLLIFGGEWALRHHPPVKAMARVAGNIALGLIWAAVFIMPIALVARNVVNIRNTNGPALRTFADLIFQTLKPGAVVLSDDPRRLALARSAATQAGKAREFAFVDTTSLNWPEYHKRLSKDYPGRWTFAPTQERVEQPALQQLLFRMAETNTLQYLHPSFGYYFEVFYTQPQALVYTLVAYGTNVHAPTLNGGLVAQNQTFWNNAQDRIFPRLIRAIRSTTEAERKTLKGKLLDRLQLTREPNRDLTALGVLYSRNLNTWGVEEQKLKLLKDAERRFAQAALLNPHNLVAEVNLACNRKLQQGQKSTTEPTKSVLEQFGKYRSWEQLLTENGLFDEPNYSYEQGRLFVQGSLYRQASQQFIRAKELDPDHIAARLWLAQVYTMGYAPDYALKEIRELVEHNKGNRNFTNQAEVLLIEASANLHKGDIQAAQRAVDQAAARSPRDANLLAVATKVFIDYGVFTNAAVIAERQLRLNPDDQDALVNRGFALLQSRQFEATLAPLNRAIELNPANYAAILNRAVALLNLERYDEARQDYAVLLSKFPDSFQVYFGLGEIGYRSKDFVDATRNYELYLRFAPPNTSEVEFVRQRLQEMAAAKK